MSDFEMPQPKRVNKLLGDVLKRLKKQTKTEIGEYWLDKMKKELEEAENVSPILS